MGRLIRVEGHNGLYRDDETGAIVNTDSSSYHSYKRRKRALEEKTNDISRLTEEMNELKAMLKTILENQ